MLDVEGRPNEVGHVGGNVGITRCSVAGLGVVGNVGVTRYGSGLNVVVNGTRRAFVHVGSVVLARVKAVGRVRTSIAIA